MIRAECNQQIGEPIPGQFWAAWLRRLSTQLRLKKDYTVSIAVVDGRTIRKFNRIYRGKDEVTDVLSFRDAEGERVPGTREYLGEILICLPRAAQQAKTRGHDLRRELAILLVHGCLHLLGHEHHEREEADRMRAIEVAVLGPYELL